MQQEQQHAKDALSMVEKGEVGTVMGLFIQSNSLTFWEMLRVRIRIRITFIGQVFVHIQGI